MALEMKANCEKCGQSLPWGAEAFICSFECTFCPACAREMAQVCPNCGGGLLARPHRAGKNG